MRIHAVSDIHVDFSENRQWLHNLSRQDYQDDVLILAGDVSDIVSLFAEALESLKKRFREVLFVPGNHDLWVHRNGCSDSLVHFHEIVKLTDACGVHTGPTHFGPLSIVPLFGWYDYSFGEPSEQILDLWVDFSACRWPEGFDEKTITQFFIALNSESFPVENQTLISFSHFLPRIDLMPSVIPVEKRILYPVLGTSLLEQQVRMLGSTIHVYGHSHVNMKIKKEGVTYINNAFGYPSESRIAKKELLCIFEC
jgi:predicted phosphodiesterase